MGTNAFLPFSNAAGANVATAADYSANSGYAAGYQSGVALSKYVNFTLRQSSLMAAAIGQFIADNGANAVDDGVITNLETSFTTALTNFINNSSLFSATKANPGFKRLPGGMIIQWGSSNFTSAGANIPFNIAFPTICVAVYATDNDVGTVGQFAAGGWNTTSFTGRSTAATEGAQWLALGF